MSVMQFGEMLIRSFQKLSPEEKAAVRAEIESKFREHEDRALLAMPCSDRVN